MSESSQKLIAKIALSIIPALLLASANCQTQATCTFKLFNAPGIASGVDDYGTVVGQSSGNLAQGFVRSSNGTVSYYRPPNSVDTHIMARNNSGVIAGFYSTQAATVNDKGFIRAGSTLMTFVHPQSVIGTQLMGINKYNTTVGFYIDGNDQSHGFKRFSNGSMQALNFPGATNSEANAINDNGTVVGSFVGGGGQHGFIFHGGTWAKVDFPNVFGATQLTGISNSNVIVGTNWSTEPPTGFLYANGVFKVISVPNSSQTEVSGISGNGLITGTAVLKGSNTGIDFMASCK